MAGAIGTPYRAPCGGWPTGVIQGSGGCYQHRKRIEAELDSWGNTTTVADWHSPPGAPIPPYPRINLDTLWPACAPAGCTPTVGQPKCGQWPDGEKPTCPTADSTHAIVESNCYTKGTDFVDHSQCRKWGFKNVQARKAWHGAFGYTSHDRTGHFDMITGLTSPDPTGCTCAGVLGAGFDCSASGFETEQPTADSTKYLTEAITATYTVESDSIGYTTGSATATHTSSVGRYTGLRTASCSDPDPSSPFYGHVEDLIKPITAADLTVLFVQAVCDSRVYNPNVTITYAGSSIHLVATATVQLDPTPTYGVRTVMDVTWTPTSLVDQRAGADNNGSYVWPGNGQSITLTSTTFSLIGFAKAWSGTNYSDTTWSAGGTLSNPYSAANFQADLYALANYWDLTNDGIYPWRHDDYTMIAPLMTYVENGPIAPDATDCTTWTLAHAGEVRGAPNPGGYGKHFDWDHPTWRACFDAGTGTTSPYPYAFGAWSGQVNAQDFTDLYMPFAATQWTPNYGPTLPLAGSLPAGAFVIHSQGIGYLQKWAEVKLHRPSYNYFRPCGADRYLMDQTTIRCVQSGSTLASIAIDSATAINTNDLCWVCGVSGIADGLYKVTKTDATHYSAVVQPFAPSAAAMLALDCTTGIIGKLRFPSARPIPGRFVVSSATQSGPNVLIQTGAGFLATGDTVDFTGVSGLGSNLTITVVDATHFTVPGTLSGSYTGGGWVNSHGAPAYSWYDDQSKGDYVYASWQFNNRDYQERQRVVDQYAACACAIAAPADSTLIRSHQASHGMPQAVSVFSATTECLSFDICNPQVMCISPNGETWNNGTTYNFGTWVADDRYGGQWQGLILQHVTDPLWQAPAAPCFSDSGTHTQHPTNCGWSEDDGSCEADTCTGDLAGDGLKFYARHPYVEARADLPAGAPSLPAGFYIGWLGLAALDTGGAVSGNVLPPPVGLGYPGISADDPYEPITAFTPWGIALREWECVCNNGQFAEDYTEQEQKFNCP